MLSSVISFALLVSSVAAYSPEAVADQVTNLPGSQNLKLNFNQFSGYLDIPGTSGTKSKHMHYWFVESQNNPSSDPITFWTNGGPGCSGLIGKCSKFILVFSPHFAYSFDFLNRFHDRARSFQA